MTTTAMLSQIQTPDLTLVRAPLTLAAALAFHVSMSPPPTMSTAEPDGADESHRRALRRAARFIVISLTKGLFWASALSDTLVILAPYVPKPALLELPRLFPGALRAWIRSTVSAQRLGLVLPFPALAGTALILAGAFLRRAAYRALGQFYACPNYGPGPCTPYISNSDHRPVRRHAHVLITDGPYAYVRHPGYAGLGLCTVGLGVLQLDALTRIHLGGTWSWGVDERIGVGMRTVVLACAVICTLGAVRRIRDEEHSLKARFKGEWEAWARKVQHKLIPGVY